jgi:hypothetical protein
MSKYINYYKFLKDFFDIPTSFDEFTKDKKITDKQKRKELKQTEFEIYKESPNFTQEILNNYTIFELKGFAKRLGLKVSPKLKDPLINKILDKQNDMFK